jgi:hypothetical protein
VRVVVIARKLWRRLFPLPKYCNLCGSELVYSEWNVEFDSQTGEARETMHQLKCPLLRYDRDGYAIGDHVRVTYL